MTGYDTLQGPAAQAVCDVRATVEVAHEALIRRWPTLRAWVDANREKLRTRAAILRAKAEWNEAKEKDEFLLPPGIQLERGRALLDNPGDVPVDDIRGYVDVSITKERQRAAAAQRDKEEALRQELRRNQRFTAIVPVLLLLSIAAGVFAWIERGAAATALRDVEKNYQLALDQAAGSVSLMVDRYDEGAISTTLMRQLIEQAQKTVNVSLAIQMIRLPHR